LLLNQDAGLSRAFLVRRDAAAGLLEKEGISVPAADVLHDLSGLLPAIGLPSPT
jgi:hypothetical protein